MRLRHIPIFILFSLCAEFVSHHTYAQNIDSLKLALKNAKVDTARIKLLSELSEVCEVEDILAYAEPCSTLCRKGLATSSNNAFYYKSLAMALNNSGYFYDTKGNTPKALEYYLESLKIEEKINDKEGIALTYNNIGSIYNNQGDVLKGLECYHKSLKLQEAIHNQKGTAYALNNIGIIYQDQGDIIKALEYFQKSLKIQEQINDKSGIAYSLNNIGYIYMSKGSRPIKTGKKEEIQSYLEKARTCFQKGLNLQEEIGDKQGITTSLSNIGLVYLNEDNITQALDYFQKSLKLQEEIDEKKGIATSLYNIASAKFKNGQTEEAFKIAERGLTIARELGYPENIKNMSGLLKKIYKKQNNFSGALEMYQLEIQMGDSIYNAENKKASVKKQFQYEYEKQAAADSVRHTEEQKVKDAQLAAQGASLKQEKTQRYALYGGLVLIAGFLVFVINRFRITEKQKKIIEEQKVLVDTAYETLHEKNKEVMDSIRYAKRIQQALLTSEKYIERNLKELIRKN